MNTILEDTSAMGTSPVVQPETLRQLAAFHRVNVTLGATCTIVAAALVFVLGTSTKMAARNRLLFTLAVADFCNCIAICMMGVDRVALYQGAVDGITFHDKPAGACASQIWLFFRTIGDLWPPIVQTMIGLEQLLRAISIDQKTCKNRSRQFQVFTIVFVVWATLFGYITAYSRKDIVVKYYCGRKATFGKPFSLFVYAHNVFGYLAGLAMNVAAYCIMKRKKESISPAVLRQLRCCMMVSILSTILVSIPNCLSVISAIHKSVSDSISKPAVYATCINSGINLFVYFVLSPEFRRRCIFLLTREEYAFVDEDDADDDLDALDTPRMKETISKQKLLEF